MPTFNQLVRKGRKDLETKSTAPALQKGYNAKKKVQINQSSPQKRGVCTAVRTAVYVTTSSEVLSMLRALLTVVRLVPSTVLRSPSRSNHLCNAAGGSLRTEYAAQLLK